MINDKKILKTRKSKSLIKTEKYPIEIHKNTKRITKYLQKKKKKRYTGEVHEHLFFLLPFMPTISQLRETFWVVNTEKRITQSQFITRGILFGISIGTGSFLLQQLLNFLASFLLADMTMWELIAIRLWSNSPKWAYIFYESISTIFLITLYFFTWKIGKTLYIKRFHDMNYSAHTPNTIFNVLFGIMIFGLIFGFFSDIGYWNSIILPYLFWWSGVFLWFLLGILGIISIIIEIFLFSAKIIWCVMTLMCIFTKGIPWVNKFGMPQNNTVSKQITTTHPSSDQLK